MTKSKPKPAIPLPYMIDFSALCNRAEAISNAFQGGNLVFFLGAGASKAYHPGFPNWPELLQDLLSSTTTSEPEETLKLIQDGKYLLAAEALKLYAEVRRDDRDEAMDRKVSDILDRKMRADGEPMLHLGVLDFGTPIVTTNFDTILESVLRQHNLDRGVRVFTFQDNNEIAVCLDPTESRSQYIFKLHGSAGQGKLILDEGDYADLYFHEHWPRALALLRHILATKMVAFVGFSLSDPEIMPLLREATRHASSYQHLAFLKADEVSKVERRVLQTHYRVDPILYEQHAELPLHILEMRNFHPRDRLTFKLIRSAGELAQAADQIVSDENLSQDCSRVLFGSYAKYGNWVSGEADLDMFFLEPSADEFTQSRSVVRRVLGRRVDATVMSRVEFESLLREGDAFASSLLVTGSPIADPNGIFALLARGLRPEYVEADLAANAYNRCKLRWVRLCALANANRKLFLRSCHQWSLTFMQLALIQRKPPRSLLQASLLGNPRYVINEFVQWFKLESDQENVLLDIMRSSKGMEVSRTEGWPTVHEAVSTIRKALVGKTTDLERDVLESSAELAQTPAIKIEQVYRATEPLMRQFDRINIEGGSLPGDTESKLLGESEFIRSFNTFDWLFFFELHQLAKPSSGDIPLLELIKSLQTSWAAGEWAKRNKQEPPKPRNPKLHSERW